MSSYKCAATTCSLTTPTHPTRDHRMLSPLSKKLPPIMLQYELHVSNRQATQKALAQYHNNVFSFQWCSVNSFKRGFKMFLLQEHPILYVVNLNLSINTKEVHRMTCDVSPTPYTFTYWSKRRVNVSKNISFV